jgi:hypothetical protein
VERDFEIVNWDRFFALYENGKLLCVTVYKKGAVAVKRRIEELKTKLEEVNKGQRQSENPKGGQEHVE